MHTSNRSYHDVVIVGGRVAGSATAMLLARLGHDVAVVDRASFPSDTTSTHSIARSGAVQLRCWGLLDVVLDSGAPAITQVTFHAGGESVSRPVKHKAGVDFVVAPRRYVLDTILAAAAERAGADVRPRGSPLGRRRGQRGPHGGRRHPVRVLRRQSVDRYRILRCRAVTRRSVLDPPMVREPSWCWARWGRCATR